LAKANQAVADNLPNDPCVHQEKCSKNIVFNDFLSCALFRSVNIEAGGK